MSQGRIQELFRIQDPGRFGNFQTEAKRIPRREGGGASGSPKRQVRRILSNRQAKRDKISEGGGLTPLTTPLDPPLWLRGMPPTLIIVIVFSRVSIRLSSIYAANIKRKGGFVKITSLLFVNIIYFALFMRW